MRCGQQVSPANRGWSPYPNATAGAPQIHPPPLEISPPSRGGHDPQHNPIRDSRESKIPNPTQPEIPPYPKSPSPKVCKSQMLAPRMDPGTPKPDILGWNLGPPAPQNGSWNPKTEPDDPRWAMAPQNGSWHPKTQRDAPGWSMALQNGSWYPQVDNGTPK